MGRLQKESHLHTRMWVALSLCNMNETLQKNSRNQVFSIFMVKKYAIGNWDLQLSFRLHHVVVVVICLSLVTSYLTIHRLFQSKMKNLKMHLCFIIHNFYLIEFSYRSYLHMRKRGDNEIFAICDLPRHKKQNAVVIV